MATECTYPDSDGGGGGGGVILLVRIFAYI